MRVLFLCLGLIGCAEAADPLPRHPNEMPLASDYRCLPGQEPQVFMDRGEPDVACVRVADPAEPT